MTQQVATQQLSDPTAAIGVVGGSRPVPWRGPSWVKILIGGLALWVATVVITFSTQNANLIPAVILVGSFLVPVTFVSFAIRRADGLISPEQIFVGFVLGGLLGVLGASVLEAALLQQPSGLGYLGVGLIEEAVKLGALWLLARRLPRYTARDGMVLGAAVGLGFAAFESAGYAFNALFTSNGLSLLGVVETEVLRGILEPFGHGVWTAILGGVLFAAAARRGRLRLTASVLGAYVLVAALHALWDASQGIAVWLTLLFTGTAGQRQAISLGQVPSVTTTQVHIYTTLSWTLLALDAVIGIVVLVALWRRTTRPVTAPNGITDGAAGAGVSARVVGGGGRGLG